MGFPVCIVDGNAALIKSSATQFSDTIPGEQVAVGGDTGDQANVVGMGNELDDIIPQERLPSGQNEMEGTESLDLVDFFLQFFCCQFTDFFSASRIGITWITIALASIGGDQEDCQWNILASETAKNVGRHMNPTPP
jgi:hypothetical protein